MDFRYFSVDEMTRSVSNFFQEKGTKHNYKTDKNAIIYAKKVQELSKIYKNQLSECQKNLNNKYIIF